MSVLGTDWVHSMLISAVVLISETYDSSSQHHKTKHVRTTQKPVFGISFPHDNAISFICIRILTLPRLMCVVYDYIRS